MVKDLDERSDWPDAISLRVWIKHEDDDLYGAMVEQFSIAGQGSSPEAALQDAEMLTVAYLRSHFLDGSPFAAASRPIPSRLRWKLQLESALSKIRLPQFPTPWVQFRESRTRISPAH